MGAAQSDPVARAVWPWRETAQGGRRRPRPARALLSALPAAAAALVLQLRFDASIAAIAVAAIAVAVALAGLLAPRAHAAIGRFQLALGRAVGTALTWILLGAVFALCFVPGRLVLLARRRDPLGRRRFGTGGSAWIARPERFDPTRYERHY